MSNSNDQSIWEILNALETKLIHSIHQSSSLHLPQLIHTSQQILDQLYDLSTQAYYQSINHLHFLYSILPITTSSSHSTPISTSLQPIPSLLPPLTHPTVHQPRWFIKLFKPRHLILITGLYLSSSFTLDLFLNSNYFHRWTRSNPSLSRRIPRWLLSSRSKKNIARRSRRSSTTTQTPVEVIVVLGADPGLAGYQIALHLTSIGYIVLASVSRAEYVAPIEKEGLGWLKALVLDPLILNQTRAFNRSLAACLQLKFPLNSTQESDPSIHHPLGHPLIGLINCLPISSPDVLRPVESLEIYDHLISPIQSITGLSLEVVKVVLPLIRNSIDRFRLDDGVILTLFPTKTTSVPLPYLAPSLIVNQTLETLMTTLRREIKISNSQHKRSIRIINEKIGSFRPSHHLSSTGICHSTTTHQLSPSLPIHLHSIYAPSLSRRVGILNLPTTGLAILSPKGNPISHLITRVQEIIQSPSIRRGSSISTGKELWKFNIIKNWLPNVVVENWLQFTENLNGWVRKKVISEIDLESNENLEKMIEKREFSSRSDWKNQAFLSRSSNEFAIDSNFDHQQVKDQVTEEQHKELDGQVENEVEGDVTVQENPTQLPNPPEFVTGEQISNQVNKSEDQHEPNTVVASADDRDDKDGTEETGSIIDKGEEASQPDHDVDLVESSTTADHLNHSFVGSEIDWNEQSTKPVEEKS